RDRRCCRAAERLQRRQDRSDHWGGDDGGPHLDVAAVLRSTAEGARDEGSGAEVSKREEALTGGMGRALLKVAQGFSVTFRKTSRRDAPVQYPKEIPSLPPRSHIGRHLLNRHANGLEKCIGCELCAW